jgi:hypothetical protein
MKILYRLLAVIIVILIILGTFIPCVIYWVLTGKDKLSKMMDWLSCKWEKYE